ncbi:hypothetical protein CCO03_10380 [Comamonas serinivorans]|uniref:UDP-N-acetylglucosamine kinase n=1 Tax=Comamonas serinivorans TaxID=1082851 RepID=A0A1Y0ENL4_9BURK|nr:AAA family ATPase [Comamonas serinivorans]ARU05038.1 hypothetical protein CCO03_10380 [Comamonas serinivorans]
MKPFILVLAGVNGAGKSSVLGQALLHAHGLPWFNPDTYARELVQQHGVAPVLANARAWQFGRQRLEAALQAGHNHAFETTLGGRTITRLLLQAARTHDVNMLFCGLTSPELHLARIAERVVHGGHDIPEDKVRERFNASRLNLIALLPHLAQLQVFDNSATVAPGAPIANPRLLLHLAHGRVLQPDRQDAHALAAMPDWARPVVQAALELSQA